MTDDWRDRIDDVDAALLNDYQQDLPVTERPYREVAAALGTTEADVADRLARLVEDGLVRRVGPVLNPPVIGSSTLAALSVPPEEVEAAAAVVNGYDAVNHNYRRAHDRNLWFVVTADSQARRDAILAEISDRTGADVLALPMLTEYDIDLTFPVVNEDRVARDGFAGATGDVAPTDVAQAALTLSPFERRVVLAVQDGLPLTATPYRDIADDLEAATADVLAAVRRLRATRAIKRIGCVVAHHAVGFASNCMVVWAVPPDEVDDRGVAAAAHPSVTYCCRRPRRPDADWPYTLFTMIHGRNRAAVDAVIDDLADEALPVDHARLHTEEVCKQTGVRYRSLFADDPGASTAPETDSPGGTSP